MPRLDGLQVCRSLRHDPDLADVSILFLTGSGTVEERIHGREQGGDDYLVKPFDLRELKARVRALLRRRGAPTPAAPRPLTLSIGDLCLNLQSRLRNVWGYTPETAEQGLVRWHMMNLRTKIERDPSHPTYLRTVPRHGYMLCAPALRHSA